MLRLGLVFAAVVAVVVAVIAAVVGVADVVLVVVVALAPPRPAPPPPWTATRTPRPAPPRPATTTAATATTGMRIEDGSRLEVSGPSWAFLGFLEASRGHGWIRHEGGRGPDTPPGPERGERGSGEGRTRLIGDSGGVDEGIWW